MATHPKKKLKKHKKADPNKKSWRKGKEIKVAYQITKERDNFKCCMCGNPIDLTVHHLMQGSNYPELRYDPMNLVTLCDCCHVHYHKIWNGYSTSKAVNLDTFITYLYMNQYTYDSNGISHENVKVSELIITLKKRKKYLTAIINGDFIEDVLPELQHA